MISFLQIIIFGGQPSSASGSGGGGSGTTYVPTYYILGF